MIGFLRGKVISLTLLSTGLDVVRIILEVNNIGYVLYAPKGAATNDNKKSFTNARVGDELEVWISHVVREDSETLYAFFSDEDRVLFEQLITVSGIGPKIALAMLANLGISGIQTAIETDDIKRLATTPGLGNKGASKIILDLKGKLVQSSDQAREKDQVDNTKSYTMLVDAIISLGFKPQVATDAADKVVKELGEITSLNLPVALKAALAKI
ncbi:MAG: Holliday junction branch migration protein RuvA [Candidatus Ancillula sp.]|jgi:Holliday junction DNA helicase RuvA|nr:Holliday junction branch migration protein RuvA [Candidatus Ancillula sp.]